jgi:hypothetical protein
MSFDLELRFLSPEQMEDPNYPELKKEFYGAFEKEYQRWYTEACAFIHQILPNRMEEFNKLYEKDPKRKTISYGSLSIQDWLLSIRIAHVDENKQLGIIYKRLETQLEIVKSAEARFNSSLFDIHQLIQADLFDHELDTARELLKKGFLRAAGAVAGVVLESHLGEVCRNHKVKVTKKNPSLGDLYDLLKKEEVIEVTTWRFIQHLADLRNLCDHNKDQEPTTEDVSELIKGVDKIAKTVF